MSSIKNVLWTSGWDSTFRIIDLFQKNATIQPIYVFDNNRASSKKELETISILTHQIQNKFKNSNGKLLPLILIQREDISNSIFLKLMYKILKSRKGLGKQYYWLASLAREYSTLELSLNSDDVNKFFTIDKLIELDENELGRNWKTNPKQTKFYIQSIFGNMRFPIIHVSKLEMKKIAEENDYIDIMNNTWFCHFSVDKPCGECNPCKQTVRDGMGYRLNS